MSEIAEKISQIAAELFNVELDAGECRLVVKLCAYPEVVKLAQTEFLPHHICNYLSELAQVFNRFYEQSRVIGDPRQAERLVLVEKYVAVLRSGLRLLGITAPERM